MKLTKKQFKHYVGLYHQMYDEETNIIEALGTCPDWKMGGWLENYYNLLHDVCECKIGEYQSILDWYCFETDFGEHDNVVTVDDVEYTIKTLDDLWDYITTVESED